MSKAIRNATNPRHIRLELDTKSSPSDGGRITHWQIRPDSDIPRDDSEPIVSFLRLVVYSADRTMEIAIVADDAERLADAIRFAVLEARR